MPVGPWSQFPLHRRASSLGVFYDFEVRALSDYAKYMDAVADAFEKQNRWENVVLMVRT